MREINFSSLTSRREPDPTHLPSRSTVYSSHRENTSSNLWDMNTKAMPWSLNSLTFWKKISVSLFVRADVGSSMIITLLPLEIAFKISIICLDATLRSPIFISGSKCNPIICIHSAVFLLRSFLFRNPPFCKGSRPRYRFSAMVISGTKLSSWETMEIPCSKASLSLFMWISCPLTRTAPS